MTSQAANLAEALNSRAPVKFIRACTVQLASGERVSFRRNETVVVDLASLMALQAAAAPLVLAS